MKNNALLIVLLLGSAVAAAQRTLPPSVRPYAENWTYTLVKSMHQAGFDMPTWRAMPGGAAGFRSGSLQLDSTKTFFGYNLNGPGDSTPLFRTVYKYPLPFVKIEVNEQFDNGAWLKLNRGTLVSDDQQRLVEATAEAFDPETLSFKPDSRLEIFPHGASPDLIDSLVTYAWDTTALDWAPVFTIRNIFDAQDRLLESLSTVSYFGDPLVFRDVYSYDANGDNHLIESFALFGDESYPGSRTESTFVDHQPLETTVFTFDGFDFIPTSRANFAYTLFGALRNTLSFEWEASADKWRLVQRLDYAYDNAQRLASKETTIMHANGATEREMLVLAYVEDQHLAQETFLLWNDDLFDWVLDSKKLYYYNGLVTVRPTPTPVRPLEAWPNPTTGVVQLSFPAEAELRVFNAAGQLQLTRVLQAGQTALDLGILPPGVYTVTAVQQNNFYSGHVVKQQ